MTQTLENAYAVIIGVDENQIDQLALPTVAKDVQALYDVLIDPQRCGYRAEHVQLCCGAEATKDSIFNALYWLQDKIKDDPDATVVIYYSGHGVFDGLANRYYLLPYDLGEMRRMRQRAISADELGAEIAVLQPQRMLIILDCCHAAGLDVKGATASQPNLSPSAFPLDLPETVNIPTFQEGAKDARLLADGYGRAILNSSTGLESSYIRRDGAMSIFTYHLIEALTGHAPHAEDDKTVLVTDVMSYVTRKVAETARDEGRQQTPVMKTTGVFPPLRYFSVVEAQRELARFPCRKRHRPTRQCRSISRARRYMETRSILVMMPTSDRSAMSSIRAAAITCAAISMSYKAYRKLICSACLLH